MCVFNSKGQMLQKHTVAVLIKLLNLHGKCVDLFLSEELGYMVSINKNTHS